MGEPEWPLVLPARTDILIRSVSVRRLGFAITEFQRKKRLGLKPLALPH